MTTPNENVVRGNCDWLLRGGPRPWLALLAFVAAFLFAAIPFLAGIDHWTLVGPCFVVCFCSVLLFIRLLIGEMQIPTLYLSIGLLIIGISAGQQWYVVALLATAIWGCDLIARRLIGEFTPILDAGITTNHVGGQNNIL